MRRLSIGLLVSLGCLLVPVAASAHARLVNPIRRVMADNNGGIKEAAKPCGGAKPATAANTYTVGQTIMVDIQETIDHPGHYELYWSNNNDATFTVIAGMNNIANPATLQASTKVALTLPATPCTNCTLQMIMVMTENPAAPTNYYSCADINLVPVGADLAGSVADLALDPTADLAAIAEMHDMAAGSDDAGVSEPGDMSKRPPAESGGLPGCSMAMGSATSVGALFIAMLMFLGAVAARRPRLASRRR